MKNQKIQTAGLPVDAVIADLLPFLEQGDLIIDAGNFHFKDNDLLTQSFDKLKETLAQSSPLNLTGEL